MQTDKKRANSRASHQRRKERGERKVTFWVSPELESVLDAVAQRDGISHQKAFEQAVMALGPTHAAI